MLEFSYKKRIYELQFNVFPVIQIVGKSASGKSLLCSDLRKHIFSTRRNDVNVVNVLDNTELTTNKVRELIHDYIYIVIDNADLLITDQIQELISDSSDEGKNFWVLMRRNDFWCVDPKCIGELREQRKDGFTLFDVVYD